MKRLLIIVLAINFVLFIRCQQSNEEILKPIVNDLAIQNETIDLMAKAIARGMVNNDFRELLRYETNKQFDYDYDVLYRFIKDKVITDEKLGSIKISDFLFKQIENEIIASSLSSEYFNYIEQYIPNLNICVPFQYKDWTPSEYVPSVASFPIDFDEKTHTRVKAFNASLDMSWLTKADSDWVKPVITVGLSERVDERGMLKVNSYDMVVEPDYRHQSADEAYTNASEILKSGKIVEYESIVKIVDFTDPAVIQMLKGKYGDFEYSDENRILVKEDNVPFELKSAQTIQQLATPEIIELYPYSVSHSIFINWADVGADRYYIYRKVNGGSFNLLDVVEWIEGTTYVDQGLASGAEYLYQIYGEKDGSNSNWSKAAYTNATWRKSNGYERLWSLYLNSDCWSDISWGRSKCEIMMRIVRYDIKNSSLILEPIGTGGASRDDQENKFYLYQTRLFRWDFSEHSNNYLIYFYEEDGGSPVTVELGVKAFFGYRAGPGGIPVTAGTHVEANASVSFSIGGRDDKMGVIEINHDEPLGFKYSIPTPKGIANCYINQE